MAPSDLSGECKVNICIPSCGDEGRARGSHEINMKKYMAACVGKIWKMGKEDPRRVIHSIKVGVALSAVSLLYLMDPLFTGVGDTAIWAVMTVVVVLEFTADLGCLAKTIFHFFINLSCSCGLNIWTRDLNSMKFGVALPLVSLLYPTDHLFNGIGDDTIWTVLTVVVVLEFTLGATLSKGLNRGLGTLVAGSLATCVSYLSERAGEPGEAIIIGFSVFVLGAAASFTRFFPTIKRRYDYGVVIFLLTFSMITVSGYRVDNIFRMAYERLSTILIGCGVCLVISLLVYPIWAGEDLHNSTADKFEGLAQSLEGCVREYFDGRGDEMDEDAIDKTSEDAIYEGYRSVLDSKATDESLATFASWEPRHGRFRYRHPWKQYVKIGANLRHLAYSIVALHGCLESEIQTPHSVCSVLKKPCVKLSEEATKLLRELSCSIRQMRRCDSETMMEHLHLAFKDLQASLQGLPKHFMDLRRWHSNKIQGIQAEIDEHGEPINSANEEIRCSQATLEETNTTSLFRRGVSIREQQQDEGKSLSQSHTQSHVSAEEKARGQSIEYAEELPLATFAWLLVESVMRIQHVVEAVDELARRAHFKKPRKPLMKVSPHPETPRSRVLENHATSQSTE